MIEFFETLSSYWNKIVEFGTMVFSAIKNGVTELITWLSLFPTEIMVCGIGILIIVVVYKIIGRS